MKKGTALLALALVFGLLAGTAFAVCDDATRLRVEKDGVEYCCEAYYVYPDGLLLCRDLVKDPTAAHRQWKRIKWELDPPYTVLPN